MLNKRDPINLEIQPRHRESAGKSRRRGLERAKAEQRRVVATPPAPTQQRPGNGPLCVADGAVAALLAIFGYPTGVLAPKPDRVVRDGIMDEPLEDLGPLPPAPKRPKRAEHEIRRQDGQGVWHRSCCTCRRWQPEDKAHFRWRTDRGGHWTGECVQCQAIRRARFYREHEAR